MVGRTLGVGRDGAQEVVMFYVMHTEDGEIRQSGCIQDECRSMLHIPEGQSLLVTDKYYPFSGYHVDMQTKTLVPKGPPQ
jgi:hypothetical protein